MVICIGGKIKSKNEKVKRKKLEGSSFGNKQVGSLKWEVGNGQ
jgi:hypothetical protein